MLLVGKAGQVNYFILARYVDIEKFKLNLKLKVTFNLS